MFSKSRLVAAGAVVLALASVLSCKKSEDSTTLPSLSGTLRFSNLPSFVAPGDEVELKIGGVTHPDGGTIGYVISVTEGYNTVKDTLEEGETSFKYKVCDREYFDADTLRAFTVAGTAYADGYYSSTTGTQTLEIVKGGMTGGSINGILQDINDETFTEDGITYYARKIGDATWLRRNVVSRDKGRPYIDEAPMLDVFGSYLNWEDAKNACPEGYRLPTDADWVALCKALGAEDAEEHKVIAGVAGKLMVNATFNYEETVLWTYWKEVKITDESGLSVLPVGYANLSSGQKGAFSGLQEYAAFWTADEADADKAWCRYIYEKSPDLQIGAMDKASYGCSVRCVKEED